MKKIAVFASGTGSNFLRIYEAIQQKELKAELTLLVSDRPKSKVVEKAKALQLNYFAFSPKQYKSKQEYETKIKTILEEKQVDLIVLAGYMRLIGSTLLQAYPKRMINIHPSLLPSFKGIDAVGQAMKAKVKVTGVTVHYIDEGMDTGEIIDQYPLFLHELTTRDEIEIEIHKIEHKLYPEVIRKVLEEM